MSYLLEDDIECPHCKYPNPVEVWSILNVKDDPELKDLVLGGELNMTECTSCHKIYYAEHFLIYHDPSQELMAFVYPYSYRDERTVWEEKTKSDFTETQAISGAERLSYDPISLFGLDELVQLVQREDEGNIQSEIVRVLGRERRFPWTELKPARARQLQFPPVLPIKNYDESSSVGDLIEGIEKLLVINANLFVYSDLLKKLRQTRIIDSHA